MSLAGHVRPDQAIVGKLRQFIERTQTPWLGEHLSFIAADRPLQGVGPSIEEPYNIGYTVAPPMNLEMVATVKQNIAECQSAVNVPIIVENPPLYFTPPGSTMSQAEFIRDVCDSTGVGLLLDLAHLFITSEIMGLCPNESLAEIPLDAIVEVHISGVDRDTEGTWDNHASRAPTAVLDLLAKALPRSRIRAITLEYNWSSRFPPEALLEELERTRRIVSDSLVLSPPSFA
jgi:hypothetical protein